MKTKIEINEIFVFFVAAVHTNASINCFSSVLLKFRTLWNKNKLSISEESQFLPPFSTIEKKIENLQMRKVIKE